MKLTDLNPRWVRSGGAGVTDGKTGEPVPEQRGVGLSFDCPCGCADRCYVTLANPLDGSTQRSKGPTWTRTGEDFETLTLAPSIQRVAADEQDCSWHGFIRGGEIIHA